jgi:hypothetical protein
MKHTVYGRKDPFYRECIIAVCANAVNIPLSGLCKGGPTLISSSTSVNTRCLCLMALYFCILLFIEVVICNFRWVMLCQYSGYVVCLSLHTLMHLSVHRLSELLCSTYCVCVVPFFLHTFVIFSSFCFFIGSVRSCGVFFFVIFC